jgi:hypothetical protein
MSDEHNDGSSTPPEAPEGSSSQENQSVDPLKQLHAEMTRKMRNSDSKIDSLMSANQQLSEQLSAALNRLAPSAPVQEEEDLSAVVYDPQKYAKTLAKKVTEEVSRNVNQTQAIQAQKNQVLNTLVQEYQELAQQDSEFSRAAIAVYNSLSEQEKASPNSYRLAAREAAANLGVLPVSKRGNRDSEDFVIPGNRTQSSGARRKASQQDQEIDQRTLAWAEVLGLDVNNPKTKASLIKNSKREWKRYQS